jgi:hypothetical protein
MDNEEIQKTEQTSGSQEKICPSKEGASGALPEQSVADSCSSDKNPQQQTEYAASTGEISDLAQEKTDLAQEKIKQYEVGAKADREVFPPAEMLTDIQARFPQKRRNHKPQKRKKKRKPLGFHREPTRGQRGAVIIGALVSALATTGFFLGFAYFYGISDYKAAYILLSAAAPFAAGLVISLIFYISILKMPLPPSGKPARQKRNRALMYIVPFLIAVFLITGSGIGFSYLSELEVADLAFIPSAKEKEEIKLISARYRADLWGEQDVAKAELLAEDLMEAPEGLYFKDINYNDGLRKSNWQTLEHLKRLYTMLCGYGEERIAEDKVVRDKLLAILNYWLNKDFVSADERANKIDTPHYLSDIGILLKPYLNINQIGRMKTILKRGSISIGAFNGLNKWTGAFLAEAAINSIRYSFFAEKPYLFKKALFRLSDSLIIAGGSAEGIKPDYTFYQNGTQAATAGYGTIYFCDAAKAAVMTEGTSLQLPIEKLALLVDFALYGQRYVYRGMYSNYLNNGFFYSRNGGNSAEALKSAIGILLSIERLPKKEELYDFYLSFDDLSYSLDQTEYIEYSRTLYDISPDYYMAVKGAYAGFINSELINNENILARNLSYGGMTLYQITGAEYENMSALWDFSMIPGTTAFYEGDQSYDSDKNLAKYADNDKRFFYGSTTNHSGGLADGSAGALYVDIVNEEGLYCRQAYFMYQGLMIAMGSSLRCSDSIRFRPVYTTIDQTYSVNTVYKDEPLKVSSKIEDELPSRRTEYVKDNAAVYNGNFAYYNLCEAELTVTAIAVTGSLSRNSPNQMGGSTENLFRLYYDFGIRPENRSFVYAVRANLHGDAPATGDGLPILNIVNTDSIQAVEYKDGTAIVVFHTAGNFTTQSGRTISAQTEGIRIVRA